MAVPALEALLSATPWPRLLHAYGRATDTPAHLRALAAPEPAGRKAALQHLGSAILHQGTPWSATPPVARAVACVLGLPAGDPDVRRGLLSFLAGVAGVLPPRGTALDDLRAMAAACDVDALLVASQDDEALYEDETASDALYAQAILGCVEVAPLLWTALRDALLGSRGAHEAHLRALAGQGAAILGASCAVPLREADELAVHLAELVVHAGVRDVGDEERCAHVCSLGLLGRVPPGLLADASKGVRLCAALAAQFVGEAAATEVLLDALTHAAEIDGWFPGERPPHFRGLPRFGVVQALLARGVDFERVVEGAVCVARLTTKYAVDAEWGPLLAAAFPAQRPPALTPAQRRYLQALVDNPALWDARFGNAIAWFQRAGLPCDREACVRLLDAQ